MKKKTSVLAIVLMLSCVLCSICVYSYFKNQYAVKVYRFTNALSHELLLKYPEDEQTIVGYIKAFHQLGKSELVEGNDILSKYGFSSNDFLEKYEVDIWVIMIGSASLLLILIRIIFVFIRSKYRKRIEDLTAFLEKMNTSEAVSILPSIEDDFAPLQDEIYKTMTNLRQTKRDAIVAKENFAHNLANITHQIKTPITSISIMNQLLEEEKKEEYILQISKQTKYLKKLAETLLLLSRIDSGVLELERKPIDIYSMLQLAVEALDEISREKEIEIILFNQEEIQYIGDMDWSIEAFLNIIKNCIEHTPRGGNIYIEYSENPLYKEIIIKDSGEGFAEDELAHIFERFYKGKRNSKNGIGIGLSLAKDIIEMQNGFIQATNFPEGGACFTIHIYSH